MKNWLSGFALVAIYRACLEIARWSASELNSIIGESAMAFYGPLFVMAAWVTFGFAARAYFRFVGLK